MCPFKQCLRFCNFLQNFVGVEKVRVGKSGEMIVWGNIDPIQVARKLREVCYTKIVSVEEAKVSDYEPAEVVFKEENYPNKCVIM